MYQEESNTMNDTIALPPTNVAVAISTVNSTARDKRNNVYVRHYQFI